MRLAIFDLDNTLIAGDSDHAWGEFLAQRQIVDANYYQRMNNRFYQDYQNGSLNMMSYLKFSLEPLTQHSREALQQLHREFMVEVIDPLWLPKAEALLQQHRDAGDFVLIITSTNRFVAEPICQKLKADDLIATELEQIDNHYTGNIIGVPCYQAGKITHLNEWLRRVGHSLDGASFYSDSINDMPLLEMIDRPVAVDPCDALRAEAEKRNWKMISLRDSS